MATKKINSFEQYLLKGGLRSEGFERWRYSFCANSKSTGAEKRFFIELYLVNPAVSPNVVVIAQKSRVAMGASDAAAQRALTSGMSGYDSRFSGQEIVVKPSYLLVKAGVYGENGKQVNKFIPSSKFNFAKTTATLKTDSCLFSADMLIGVVEVTEGELRMNPEMLCNPGFIKWELKYENSVGSSSLFGSGTNSWVPIGFKSKFVGNVVLDGEEYVVTPEKSFGYVDKSWGETLSNPYYHISTSRLTSIISGKGLESSYVSIEGEFGKKKELNGVINIEGKTFKVGGLLNGIGLKETHKCTQLPSADGEKLHWSVSLEKGEYVVDLDVYCKTSEMFVRDYEVPQGKRMLMKVLGGGTGNGEVRIFRKVGKNLELLEHANLYDTICELGEIDAIES
ncbi:MAG: hypothetical protein IKP49_01120 [Treponema sp.]|nr:hypothetical protein [Treponema sp.]